MPGSIPAFNFQLYGVWVSDDDVTEEFGRKGCSAVRSITCDWDDRVTIINQAMGGAIITAGTISFVSPDVYPAAPFMYITQISCRGEGTRVLTSYNDGLQMVGYQWAKVQITYQPLDFNITGSEGGAEELEFGYELLRLPPGAVSYNYDGTVIVAQPAPYRIGTAELTKEIKSLAQLPTTIILALVGTLNNAEFLGAPTGQLIYKGCRSTRRYTGVGYSNWDVQHHFQFRSQRWDFEYQAPTVPGGAGAWKLVQFAGGNPLYQLTDFTTLGISATEQA